MAIKPKPKTCGGCNQQHPLWKAKKRGPDGNMIPGLCKNCAMKEDPKPINKVSESKKQDDKTYTVMSRLFLDNRQFCEARVKCDGAKATEVHHTEGRIGSRYLDIRTWMAICPKCHRWAHDNDAEARKLGILKSRLDIKYETDSSQS